jgi:copper(I)-binding protein
MLTCWKSAALAALMVVAVPGLAAAKDFKAGDLTIESPWSRATPGGAKVAAGYATIRNDGTAADTLLSVEAPAIAGRTEIHEVADVDGVMKMRHLPDGLALPAGGSVVLKPRSYHLMFMDLKRPLADGDSFTATLRFAKAGAVEVSFQVAPVGASAPAAPDHQHHHMGH